VPTRGCKTLPIPLKPSKKLLEVDDAKTRLTIIQHYLQQHEII